MPPATPVPAAIDPGTLFKLIADCCQLPACTANPGEFDDQLSSLVHSALGLLGEVYHYHRDLQTYLPHRPGLPRSAPGLILPDGLKAEELPEATRHGEASARILLPLDQSTRPAALLAVATRDGSPLPPGLKAGLTSLAAAIGSCMERQEELARARHQTKKAEVLGQALFDINELAHHASNEQQLYQGLHHIVARLLNATNFFIALGEERGGEQFFRFVYYCDEFDSDLQGTAVRIDPEAPLSMTAYLMQSRQPKLLLPEDYDRFCRENNVNPIGKRAYSLVGAPFFGDHLTGVVLVQTYHQERYTEGDKDLLAYVARHIGEALGRKKALDEMRESERRYRILFEKSPLAMVSLDSTGTIIDCNEKFVEMMGSSRAKLIGFHSAAKSSPKMRQTIAQALAGEIAYYEDTYVSITGGKTSFLRGFFSPVTPGRTPTDIIAILEDITERKKDEEERQKIEKLSSLGVLAGGIAHDFNNILTGIMGNISFVRALLNQDHQGHGPLEEAIKATRKASELAQQLLTFAKGGEPEKKVVQLSRLLHDAIALSLGGSTVRPAISLSPKLHAIRADQGQLGQVINNLIINACQAMPKGGVLSIIGKNEHLAEGNHLALPAGNYVRLEFHDQGCGIAMAHLSKIFDPYFSTKSGGTGLGLAAAYSIIKRHLGHIEVHSQEGLGSSFILHLPAAIEAEAAPPRHASPRPTTGGRLLVMDDDRMIRDLATAMLGHLGYTVVSCGDGEAAITLYRQALAEGQPFLAVILDLTIPGGLGGKEAAEQLLAIDDQARLIVSSGYSNDPIMADHRAFGFSGAIAKPYTMEEFQTVLNSLPPRPPQERPKKA